MSYTWTNGEVITAEKLNQTSGGGDSDIFIVRITENNGSYTADKTYQEISDAVDNGKLVFAFAPQTGLFPLVRDGGTGGNGWLFSQITISHYAADERDEGIVQLAYLIDADDMITFIDYPIVTKSS